MNILYVVLHGKSSDYRYEGIIKTWAKNKNIIFYSDYEDIDKKIHKVSNITDYSSNEEKHLNAFLLVNKLYMKYDWFFFCDDDTFVNTKYLENTKFDENFIHGSVITGCWPYDKNLEYCSGGAGYLISKNILIKIYENLFNSNTGFSDVSLGYIAKKCKIPFLNDDRFRSQNPSFFNTKDDEIKNFFTFHYVKTKDDQTKLLNLCL